jgi:hypothetical protein
LDEAFGIYRALDPKVGEEWRMALRATQVAANKITHWKRGVRFTLPEEFGVTFLTRYKLSKAMAGGSIERRFDPDQFRRRFEAEPRLQRADDVRVPIGGFDWYGVAGRKLVIGLAPSREHITLLRQSDLVEDMLHDTGAEVGKLRQPDHMTVLRFGVPDDFRTPQGQYQNRIRRSQREDIEGILRTRLAQAGLESVALTGFAVGDSYEGEQALQPVAA